MAADDSRLNELLLNCNLTNRLFRPSAGNTHINKQTNKASSRVILAHDPGDAAEPACARTGFTVSAARLHSNAPCSTVPWRWCGWSASRPRCGSVLRCSPCDPGTSCCASAGSGRWWRRGWSRPHRSWWRARVAWPRCPERWWWSGGGSWIRLSPGSRSPRSERRGYWERSPYLSSDAPPESDPR